MSRIEEKKLGLKVMISYLEDICFYTDLSLSLIPKEIVAHIDKVIEYLQERLKEMRRD